MLKTIKNFIPRRFYSNRLEIPVVRLQGVIAAHRSGLRPPLCLASCTPLLEKAFGHKEAPAVALLINSPGGSPVQSHLVFKRIRQLAEEKQKHVFCFVEDVAASGGYMIACAGDEIFADPSSIVGSIGVISSSFGFVDLLKKIGVQRRIYTAGKNKSILDPFSPEKKSDIDHLKSLQAYLHENFIALVKERRKDKLSADANVFDGLFWTGKKAEELGLIDGLGDIATILKKRYGNEVKLKLVEAPKGLLRSKIPSGLSQHSSAIASALMEAFWSKCEEKSLWERYNL